MLATTLAVFGCRRAASFPFLLMLHRLRTLPDELQTLFGEARE
jgi:hypothetical protein